MRTFGCFQRFGLGGLQASPKEFQRRRDYAGIALPQDLVKDTGGDSTFVGRGRAVRRGARWSWTTFHEGLVNDQTCIAKVVMKI